MQIIYKRKRVAKHILTHSSPLTVVVNEESVGSRDVCKDLLVVSGRIKQMTLLLITISSHVPRNK